MARPRSGRSASAAPNVALSEVAVLSYGGRAHRAGRADRPDHAGHQRADPVAAGDQLRPVLGPLWHHELRPGAVLRRRGLRHRAGRPRPRVQPALGTLPLAMLAGLLLPACSRPSCCSAASRRPASSWRWARSPAPTPPSGWSRAGSMSAPATAFPSVKLLQLGTYEFVEGHGVLLSWR